jgi:hypothetical protein
MAKYKEGRADIMGYENWTIRNPKLDSPVSLSQTSTSTAESSSDKCSRTPLQQNLEVRDRRQWDYHSIPYFPVEPPMPRPWGPPSMSYPPCPPEVGLYGPWGLPMHLQPRWSGPTDGFGHGGYYAGDGRYGYVDHLQDRRTPRQDNQMV